MSAWIEKAQDEASNDSEKKFEDNFVSSESSKEFKKLEDSEQYLHNLGSCCEIRSQRARDNDLPFQNPV